MGGDQKGGVVGDSIALPYKPNNCPIWLHQCGSNHGLPSNLNNWSNLAGDGVVARRGGWVREAGRGGEM